MSVVADARRTAVYAPFFLGAPTVPARKSMRYNDGVPDVFRFEGKPWIQRRCRWVVGFFHDALAAQILIRPRKLSSSQSTGIAQRILFVGRRLISVYVQAARAAGSIPRTRAARGRRASVEARRGRGLRGFS
ncbi:DUF2958 domain-containing protein [Mesorhizobium sp. dw_380]|uniref:DUF2958 domain-containing protein n=1 Tax=Mesorhizobium sp. dw_380 TaxID=2812001 RepID=UPI001BDE6B52|nr:DUF2958 domain-containing protein [Mesorhizobium sp. dw_380]